MVGAGNGVEGYICTPYEKESAGLVETWSRSFNISNIYFVTATFSNESLPYFPNRANHYILISFSDTSEISEIMSHNQNPYKLSFMFNLSAALFEREVMNLKYISMYFTRYTYGDAEIADIANIIARREKVRRLGLGHLQFLTTEQPKFTFPYSKNVVLLEVEGEKTHQSDQKYCEKTRRDVARKGIPLTNLISLSILDRMK